MIGFAPLGRGADRRYVRVDLPARVLARQRRSLAVLTVAVMSINAALAVLLLFFLRHLLAPGRRCSRGPARWGAPARREEDEIDFLLATFDRALTSLAGRQGRSPEDDIAALERTLSASLQSGLLLIDREGRVLALNAVGAALLGTELPEPGSAARRGARRPARAARDPGGGGGRGDRPAAPGVRRAPGPEAGETLTVGLTVHPLRRDDGEVRGLLVLFADLTEARRRAEEGRLAESLAQLGEMAGGVAHELRNGLATLRGYLTLIERRPDEDSIADFLSEIRGEADHLERVLQDFLSFARPGTARRARALARPPAAARRRRSGPRRRRGARPAGRTSSCAAIRSSSSAPCATCCTTPRRPSARRGGGGRSRSRSRWSRRGSRSRSRTAAPGCRTRSGRACSTPSPPAGRGGVGLGLALAHRIVVLHGGRIRLEDRPGGGTRALLSFPRDTIVTMGNETPAAGSSPPEP